MKKILVLSTMALALAATTSCSNYLDINEDPNSPSSDNITASILMPNAELNLANAYGNMLRIQGGYLSEHYAQEFGTSNYLDYSQFNVSPTNSDRPYNVLYDGAIKNLTSIQQKAEASSDWGSYLAATTLRAFAFQTLADMYGSCPYTEAIDASNTSPKYDSASVVYSGIINELNYALSKVSSDDEVCTNFLYSGQKASAWVKFAKALKLKILMRESGVVDVQKSLDSLITENDFPTASVAYTDCWGADVGSQNPYYSEEFYSGFGSNQQNVVLNLALYGTMSYNGYTDPRLYKWFNANNSGEYTGGISGSNMAQTKLYKSAYFCRPNISYDSPVYLISLSEIDFFKAEYYAKKNDSVNAAKNYAAAVEASFADAGADGAAANIARYPYSQTNWKRSIGIAKWVALGGTNNFEAWCELRRLRYPQFMTKATETTLYDGSTDASYKPENYEWGTLYTPYKVYGLVGSRSLLERYPYSNFSISRNSNTPSFNNGYKVPVFWAVSK